MISSFAKHIYLLLSLSHNGKGLPSSLSGIAVTFMLYMGALVIRWILMGEDLLEKGVTDEQITAGVFFLGALLPPLLLAIIAGLKSRAVSGYFLIYTGISGIGILFATLGFGLNPLINGLIAMLGMVALLSLLIKGVKDGYIRRNV